MTQNRTSPKPENKKNGFWSLVKKHSALFLMQPGVDFIKSFKMVFETPKTFWS